jgi:rhodanese-related sulfurtransferase
MGSLLWSTCYVLCGFLFAKQVDRVLAIINNSGLVVALCVLIPFIGFVGWRGFSILKMVQKLRMRRIAPALLHARLIAGEEIVVIDLLNFQEGPASRLGIEGAVRIDPARLRSHARILAPAGLAVVLYCSSSDQFRSARVAMLLKRKGITQIWVLEGGLAAWTSEGFPVSEKLLGEEEVVRRFGLQILDGKAQPHRTPQLAVSGIKKEYQDHA